MTVKLPALYSNVVPSTLHYRLHSAYWSRRRHKPHDFTVEVIIDFEFLFPDFVTCKNTKLASLLRPKYYVLKATYKNIEATIIVKDVKLIEEFRKRVEKRGKPYSIRYLMRWFKEDRDYIVKQLREAWGITKKLAEAIANDIFNYLINGVPFKIVGWRVRQEGIVDVNELYSRIKTPFSEYYPDAYEGFIRDVLIGIDDIVREWFENELYWAYPVEGELSELDGGVEFEQMCNATLQAVDIRVPDWLNESFRITNVEYRKADAYDVEPTLRDYWSRSLEDFLEANKSEIIAVIWNAYVNNILRKILEEVNV